MNCVVDGDTVWIAGIKYRLEEIDAPERGAGAECRLESDMAMEATIRLAHILFDEWLEASFRAGRIGMGAFWLAL